METQVCDLTETDLNHKAGESADAHAHTRPNPLCPSADWGEEQSHRFMNFHDQRAARLIWGVCD